ncbi:DUF2690 domain-containing protein [Kineococcus aurantiacus]|uniref:Uncharacterized protein n=1 Tax=Kineococcus aurantiacus TaxID=37633 RepID=A0A7Y9ASK3_9ACTN|nr:DUF2690 domain-containing protein [Kineococcus aurantiacus]NYD21272.1 hypothetical protein [Kineococcus aurantiacus]
MKISHRSLSALAAVPLVVGLLTAGAGGAQAASLTCPSSRNPSTLGTATTPASQSVAVGGQSFRVELRYSPSTRFAWGRVTKTAPAGTTAKAYHLWTDRRSGTTTDGQMCQVNRPGGYLVNGGQDWTSAIDDAGYLMRACFKLRDYSQVTCTGWY